ncbi:MAG TPA: hypothetical protein VF665_09110 [Longimicrobium sp.]|jgi:hypothetical protein|uniref:hypothetical protein n=1 Tax=Longimicrobium sp. TaxID=2029185 RepID=UPI002EDA23EC
MFSGLGTGFWIAASLALLCGAALAASGLRRPRRMRRVMGGAGLLGAVVLAGVLVPRTSVEAWNAVPRTDDVPGEWRAGASWLKLRWDGTYELHAQGTALRRIGMRQSAGRWSRDDWNLHLADNAGPRIELRFVVIGGEYRIVEQPGDPDGWRAWPGLARDE